jgi:hypothetical protein
LRDQTYKAAAEVLGPDKRKHKDWFDEQDAAARALLDELHETHLVWIKDKTCQAKNAVYNRAKQSCQAKLREMKEKWWSTKAAEMQKAADRHDLKRFCEGLNAICGPRSSGSAPVRTRDGSTLITERSRILERWAEHFQSVLNQPSTFDRTVLDEIPQLETAQHLADIPSLVEVLKAIRRLQSGKAPGADAIPPEIYKYGGSLQNV